jgi:hypothetical protein
LIVPINTDWIRSNEGRASSVFDTVSRKIDLCIEEQGDGMEKVYAISVGLKANDMASE